MDMLKPGGRMGIVLPRGILKNYSDEYVRRHILKHLRILAVVGLGKNMFKSFTNTKTCVLFVKKREVPLNDIADAKDDPKIVFSVTEKPGKDKTGKMLLDSNGNVVSDLDEIATFVRNKMELQ